MKETKTNKKLVENSSFHKLYKKIDVTCKTRFRASRRLKIHARFSTYTLVIYSLGLILISLLHSHELIHHNIEKHISLISAYLAISILVYSLLIDKHDYSSLSAKLYACASKLGDLKQKAHPHLDGDEHNADIYKKYRKRYRRVLKLYETDSINDFRGDYYLAQLELPKYYPLSFFERLNLKFKAFILYALNFLSYIIVLSILGSILIWLLFQAFPTH